MLHAPGMVLAPLCSGGHMLQLALIFLVVGLLAGVLGFTSIAGASFAIAKFLAGLFLVLFLVFLILAMAGARKVRKIVD
jgi:uncharacterized membrane protein YtjA (UPF0391 family)